MTQVRKVSSNQQLIAPGVLALVTKHLQNPYQAPIAQHNQQAFIDINARVSSQSRPLVLDSGCGTGLSTIRLAQRHADCWVIGVDRSLNRLGRQDKPTLPDNCLLVRADLVDFWRLAWRAGWRLAHHYFLYPNPWPKQAHLKRRWHGHPIFPTIIALQGRIELRSNWAIYVDEFALALQHLGYTPNTQVLEIEQPLTPFEKKYHADQQPLYRCHATI